MKTNLNLFSGIVMLVLLLSCGFKSAAQDAFITVWQTDNAGGYSNNNQVLLRATGGYNYTWENTTNAAITGSGTNSGDINNPLTITFPATGTYRIRIVPTGATPFNRFDFNSSSSDAPKLIGIEQWGDAVWSSMEYAFSNAYNLTAITAIDTPNLTNVTSMREMFSYTGSLTSIAGINNWDVSQVTNMQSMFQEANHFNSPLNNWNTGNVTTMNQMFSGAFTFNQDIGAWNTGNVRNTYAMFEVASAFDQNIGNWNLPNDTIMAYMFNSALNFNQDISAWNVGNVKRMDFMFQAARAFDQPIGSWNVSSVTNMNTMFMNANSFNQPLNQWNVSAVTNMQKMFQAAYPFDQQLSSWNLASVTNVTNMFSLTSLSCSNYSNTLIGWAANTNTPNSLSLTNNNLGSGDPINYSTSGQTARNTLTTTKSWTITGDSYDPTCITTPLPLKLLRFDAYKQNGQALLQWTISSDENIYGFEIEKSTDGKTWEQLGFTNSRSNQGNNNSFSTYNYIDNVPFWGTNYYRLKQIGKSGQFEYSNVTTLDFGKLTKQIHIYPNPAKNTFNIALNGNKRLVIINQVGQQIFDRTFDNNITSICNIVCEGWAKGIYFVKTIDVSGNINIVKMTKD